VICFTLLKDISQFATDTAHGQQYLQSNSKIWKDSFITIGYSCSKED